MSNFGENKTFSQIFHEQQTSHYGIQSGAAPHMSSSSQNITESRGQATHSSQHKNGPYPAGSKSSVPSRKPVGGDRTKPSASTTKNQQESSARANRSGGPDLNKALPRIPDNAIPPFIARDATGKFNQRFKTPEGNAPQAPVGFTQRVDLPALAKAQLQSLATPPPTAPKAPRPTTPRPDSSKGLPSMERKRTNSAMSGFFSPSTSRRGSLTEAARNAGKWAKGKADILTMNQAERDSFMKGATRAHEREVEAARRADPSTRPFHQQKMLVEKQKASHPGEAWGAGPAEASFEAQMQERAFRSRTAKEYMKRHEQECAVALLEGRLRPPTPEAGKYSPPAGSLTSEERAEALEFDPESEVMMLTKTEKIALQLSRKLDAFKSSRKDSDCSDMDFGMTDAAPVGAIQFCGEMAETTFYNQGCHMPSRTHLKMGLCEACYAFKKHLGISDSRDSSTTRRIRGHNPKSPEDDAAGGDLYIRVSTQRRLRKVRNTVYEDPGNPFDFRAFDIPLSSSTSQETLIDDHTLDDEQCDRWTEDDSALSHEPDGKMNSMLSNSFDLIEVHSPTDSRREILRSSQPSRRSMHVDIALMPTRRSMEPSDTDQQWPGDVPLLHTRHPSGTIFTTESKRNTQFYDFYDDLLAEYGVEKSTGYGSIDHRLLSVTF